MQVWCVVPLIRQRRRDRCLTLKEYLQARPVVSEVREAHYDISTYSQGLFEHYLGLFDLLETLVENHVVERLVTILGQARIDIPVQNAQAFGDTLVYCLLIYFDALTPALPLSHQD